MMKKVYSDAISNINFPLMVGVVAAHSVIFDSGNVVMEEISRVFLYLLPISIVPIFFTISGFLFFTSIKGGFNKDVYCAKVRSRVRTLMVPYLIANTFTILCYALMHWLTPSLINPQNFNVLNWNVIDYIQAYWSIDGFPICYQLWYIRNLFVLILLTPIFYVLIRQKVWIQYSALLLIGLMYHVFSISFLLGVFYFYIGALLSFNEFAFNKRYLKSKKSYVLGLVIVITFLAIYNHYLGLNVFIWKPIQRFFVVFLTLYFFVIISEKFGKLKCKLFESSFFMYAYHAFPVLVLRKLWIMLINPNTNFEWIIAYVAIVLSSVFFCCFVYQLIQKLFPKFTSVIVGGRVS